MTASRRPGLLTDLGAAALALVLVAIAAMLGKWQYDAWQAHRDAEARDLTGITPVPLTDVMGSDDRFPAPDLGRPVEVAGEWLDGGFWVAERELNGQAGYWAVAPLQVDDSAVLVVRGWAAEPDPALLEATGDADLTGWLQAPDGSLVTDANPSDDVFPEIRVADAVQRVDVDLYSAYLVAQEPAEGLRPADLEALPSPSRFTGVRNLLYALEWWVFGAFAAFIWWRWRRDATAPEVAEAVDTTEVGQPTPDRLSAVSRTLTAYRVMATIVGVLLVVLCLIGVPLANFDGSPMWGVFDSTPMWVMPGSDLNELGDAITTYLGVAHGWLYMIFLFCAFLLSRRAGWDLPFTLVTLVCGTIPVLSFWAEHRATQRVRAEHPQTA